MSGSKVPEQVPSECARVGEDGAYEVDLAGLNADKRELLEQARQLLGVATLAEAMAILSEQAMERVEAPMRRQYKSMVGLSLLDGGKL